VQALQDHETVINVIHAVVADFHSVIVVLYVKKFNVYTIQFYNRKCGNKLLLPPPQPLHYTALI